MTKSSPVAVVALAILVVLVLALAIPLGARNRRKDEGGNITPFVGRWKPVGTVATDPDTRETVDASEVARKLGVSYPGTNQDPVTWIEIGPDATLHLGGPEVWSSSDTRMAEVLTCKLLVSRDGRIARMEDGKRQFELKGQQLFGSLANTALGTGRTWATVYERIP